MDAGQAIAVGAALSAFSFGAQHDRLMRLDFPRGDGPEATLLPNRMVAHEEVSRCFRFDVELLSDDTSISLKSMMARMVTISLVREDGSLRYFNGYVTEFRLLRADGGFAFYQMVLEPWMAFTKLRKDNVSFHGKSVVELSELTFAHYRQADWNVVMTGDDPRITCANQYDETDYNHLHRRWEALGLMYWYEHRADGHTLWLSDKSTLVQPIDPTGIDDSAEIPFRDKAGSIEDDGIRTWAPARRLGSGQTTLTSFDYKNPIAQRARAESLNEQGDVFPHDVHENTGSNGFKTYREGEKFAQRRIGERDAHNLFFDAGGNDRTVQPGRFFKLADHFSAEPQPAKNGKPARGTIADRHYLILSVEHEASNNYQAGPNAPSNYENTFRCTRKDITWRPGRDYNSQACTYPGIQTAIVVGPAGSEIHTDGYGRVKVQFHWDRLGNYDENSSPWLRVMSPGAGSEFGNIRLPRVGEEVAVLYLDANIDHPVILGGLHNALHMPQWKLPEQQALSGLRSRELKAAAGSKRGNHLVLDDTAGKIQAQLKSDHQCSQLSLGHITRIEDTKGRKEPRGEGWELRTDGHGVARAAKGMLVTTEVRAEAHGPIKDLVETSDRLTSASRNHQNLAKLAKQNGAQESGENQADVTNAIQEQSDAITGTKDAGDFPELVRPHLVFGSQAGIATASAGDTHFSSDGHTAITTGKSLSFATSNSLFANVCQAIRLFVQKAGLKVVAAAGDIDIQALSDSINLLAKLNISQSANRITITAKEQLIINCGGSYAKFAAGSIEFGTSGSISSHATKHSFLSAKNMSANMTIAAPAFDQLQSTELTNTLSWVEFKLVSEDGPIQGERYILTDPNNGIHTGNIDNEGIARIENIPAGRCKVEFPDLGYSLDVSTT